MIGLLFFVATNTLVLGISISAGELFFGSETPWRKALLLWAGVGVLAQMTALVIGMAGQLGPGPAVVVLSLVFGVLLIVRYKRSFRGPYPNTTANDQGAGKDETRGSLGTRLALTLLAAAVAPPVLRLVLGGPHLGWDDYSYHAAFPAQWLIDGAIRMVPLNYHAYYPFNSELLSLWFMLPFGSDGLVGLSGAYWLILLALASYAYLREVGSTVRIAAVGCALALASPVIGAAAARFSASDLAAPTAMLASAALLVRRRGNLRERLGVAETVFAGMMAGIAVGTKALFFPAAVSLFLWVLLRQPGTLEWMGRIRAAILFAVGAMSTGSWWYLRNLFVAGNPLFPAQVGPFGGPFTTDHQWQTRLIRWIVEHPWDSDVWGEIAAGLTDWPLPLAMIAIAGLVRTIYLLFRTDKRRQQGAALLMAPLLGLALIHSAAAIYVPFSGTENAPGASLAPEPRFLIFPFVSGILMFAATLRRGEKLSLFEFLAIAGAWYVLLVERAAMSLIVAALIFAALYGERFVRPILGRIRFNWRTVAIGLAVLLFAALGAYRPVLEGRIDKRVYSYRVGSIPIGAAWKSLEKVPEGSRITALGEASDQMYPLYGRRLQLRPVALAPSGQKLKLLHELWREDPTSAAWWGERAQVDSQSLLRSLRDEEIRFVLCATESQATRSAYEDLFGRLEGASVMYDDGFSTLWKLP